MIHGEKQDLVHGKGKLRAGPPLRQNEGFVWAERRCTDTDPGRGAEQSHLGMAREIIAPVTLGSSPPYKTLSEKQGKGVEGSSW